MNEQAVWKQKIPIVSSTLLLLLTLYFFGWSWAKSISIVVSQYHETEVSYGTLFFGSGQTVSIFLAILITIVAKFAWQLSTRVSYYKSKQMRVAVFVLTLLTIWGTVAAYGMAKAREVFLPFFQERLADVIVTDGFFESIVFEQTKGFYLMLTMLPVFVLFFITTFVYTKYTRHDKELNAAFLEYEWSGKWLQRFSKLEQKAKWPDIELGLNTTTNEMLILRGRDRTLNTMIIGSIGTGKTAALALPMLNQDLNHMTQFINDYPVLYEREDFKTEDIGGRYMSGISVIDPSNDLCQKTLKLVKAHGIPDEAITYINPLDPNTPSINPMRGPVDKVAEVFAQVIAGLNDSKDGGNFFFEQAQRNHLKHYIYLLKLHDLDEEVTFDMLLDMYNNPQLVHKMHLRLKKTFPKGYNDFENRDERNYWKIVQGIDEWFDLNLLPKMTRRGPVEVPEIGPNGEPLYYDAKEEHVQGLRNILNDIGANPLIRRVLFGKSDFDFDRHMEVGGVLLVNTAKGELVNLARVLGKIILMNLQNATFRREPDVSSFHHILVDEAPDYLYNAFNEFPAQSRKYKVIVTTLQQTIAQMADQFGEHYMTTLIGTMRNRMVYGDVPGFDAKYFSEMFGEKYVYEEGQNEMDVSPLQENPMTRSGSSYTKVREEAMTSGDIMFQDAFQCAVKIVANNKPMPVVQIAANFVPSEQFEVSTITTTEEAVSTWLEQRRLYGIKEIEQLDKPIASIEETEAVNEKHYKQDSQNAIEIHTEETTETVTEPTIDKEMVESSYKAVANPNPKPTDEVMNYPVQPSPVKARANVMPLLTRQDETAPTIAPVAVATLEKEDEPLDIVETAQDNEPEEHKVIEIEQSTVVIDEPKAAATLEEAGLITLYEEVPSNEAVEEQPIVEEEAVQDVAQANDSTEEQPIDFFEHYVDSELNPAQNQFFEQLSKEIQDTVNKDK